jgi:hypothetical protein
MIGRALCVALSFAFVIAARCAHADVGLCSDPTAYQSAVNIYVLEDQEQDAEDDLNAIRLRLAWLVKLDAIFRDSFGSLSVHFLRRLPGEKQCSLDSVIERSMPRLPKRSAAAFVEQRVFREGQEITTKSHVRFFRVDDHQHEQSEAVELKLPGRLPTFAELLPAQRASFPPQLLSPDNLDAIASIFVEAVIYPEAFAADGIKIDLSPATTLRFSVTETRPDGWVHIDGASLDGPSGWLHFDSGASDRLRQLLPELSFLEGVVGYLKSGEFSFLFSRC